MSTAGLTEMLMGQERLTISPALTSVSSSETKEEISGEDTKHTAVTLLFDLRFGTWYELVCEISFEV